MAATERGEVKPFTVLVKLHGDAARRFEKYRLEEFQEKRRHTARHLIMRALKAAGVS